MNKQYSDFLLKKSLATDTVGIKNPPALAEHLFSFQRASVEFNLRVGRSGLFLDTGLGKTECQLEWCQKAIEATNSKAVIFTPLAVAAQTKRRAERWGYDAQIIREQADAKPGINICNYERLDHLDPSQFGIVSLDEASILKSFTGKTTKALVDSFQGCRFKMAATATPAPNDHMELGNYAEFLELMHANEMLSRFFINDTSTASQHWRLKGYAENAFWDWMTSFARMAEKPSDITGDEKDDTPFILPPINIVRHRARDPETENEFDNIFGDAAMSATSLHDVKRKTVLERAEKTGEIVSKEPKQSWLIWCDTNYESEALKAAIPQATEVRGSMTTDEKEDRLLAFENGQIKYLITKPSLTGFGMDWSHCSNMAFVGRNYSYETWYQAIRRCWRFGQKNTVNVHLVVAEGETTIGNVIDQKADQHSHMKDKMREAMRRAVGLAEITKIPYMPKHKTGLASWIKSAV
jgi:hypothetical protein